MTDNHQKPGTLEWAAIEAGLKVAQEAGLADGVRLFDKDGWHVRTDGEWVPPIDWPASDMDTQGGIR